MYTGVDKHLEEVLLSVNYITHVRLPRVLRMLRESPATIAEIALWGRPEGLWSLDILGR
jgi:hypothetical protein